MHTLMSFGIFVVLASLGVFLIKERLAFPGFALVALAVVLMIY